MFAALTSQTNTVTHLTTTRTIHQSMTCLQLLFCDSSLRTSTSPSRYANESPDSLPSLSLSFSGILPLSYSSRVGLRFICSLCELTASVCYTAHTAPCLPCAPRCIIVVTRGQSFIFIFVQRPKNSDLKVERYLLQ